MFFIVFIAFACIGYFYGSKYGGISGSIAGVVAAAIVSFIAFIFTRSIAGGVGSSAGSLFSGRRPIWTIREQLAATLSHARKHKNEERFEEALSIVNGILEKDQEFPEALFLKAQIMWNGFENLQTAKKYLAKIMQVTEKDDKVRNQASSLYKELIQIEKIRNIDST